VFGNEPSYTLLKEKNFYKINTPSMLEWFCLEMAVGNMLVILKSCVFIKLSPTNIGIIFGP
jgi:hypothetical protein